MDNSFKTISLDTMIDRHLGVRGTPGREAFENELRIDLLGHAIKQARMERHLTQQQLGDLVGVQKSQISKIENSIKNARFETLLKVFNALETKVSFQVETWSVLYTDEKGKNHRIAAKTKNRSVAEKILANYEAEIDRIRAGVVSREDLTRAQDGSVSINDALEKFRTKMIASDGARRKWKRTPPPPSVGYWTRSTTVQRSARRKNVSDCPLEFFPKENGRT
jgi:transcriptional regulator with XRE-family HTH domain